MMQRLSVLKPSARSASAAVRPTSKAARTAPCMRAAAPEKVESIDAGPTAAEVESLLSSMVQETDIMEMQLQIGDFQLNVKRSLAGAPPPTAHVEVVPPPPAMIPRMDTPVKASAPRPMLLESVDESILPVFSPKVGIFRRGRYAGNKRVGKGNCVNEGDTVKKGQPIGYVEQLGTFVPVEATQGGEIVKFDLKEGEAVEYGQTVV
eukprot:gene13340-19181_t